MGEERNVKGGLTPNRKGGERGKNGEETQKREKEERERMCTVKTGVGGNTRKVENGRPPFLVSCDGGKTRDHTLKSIW